MPEIFEARQFVLGSGDNDFAALFVGDAVFTAERDHFAQPADAQLRLFGAGFVIKAGMQHAAVVSGLMRGELWFFFEQQQPGLRPCFQKAMGRGQADNAAAHDDPLGCPNPVCPRYVPKGRMPIRPSRARKPVRGD